jgi:hypothetical protein
MANSVIILDYEYWTAEGAHDRKRRGMHDLPPLLIQTGAIRLGLEEGLPELDALDDLVIPRDLAGNQIMIDEFASDLFGYGNDEISKRGFELAPAMDKLKSFIGDDLVFSYGPDDLSCSVQTCHIHGVEHPFPHAKARDVRKLFYKAGVDGESLMKVSSGEIAAFLGLPKPAGHHTHNALDDVRSIARALRHFLELGKIDVKDLTMAGYPYPWGTGDII